MVKIGKLMHEIIFWGHEIVFCIIFSHVSYLLVKGGLLYVMY